MVKQQVVFYKSLWNLTVSVCQEAQVPLYVERHDPKVFTTVQKVFLWFYKTKKKLTLRGLVDDLQSSKVVEYLRLQRIPDFSMLSYFISSIPMRLLHAIDETIQNILPSFDEVIIDSTGFECTRPSHYYCQRIDSKYPSDGFLTLHAVIDREHGFVRTHKTATKKVHDSKMFKPLMKKLNKKPKIIYADRGYDSEENYRFCIEDVGCVPLILQKNMLKPLDKCTGEYRRQMRAIFDYGEYLKRNKIEGVFGGIKRQYGCSVTTRRIRNQHKELLIKIITYNLTKKLQMIIITIHVKTLSNKT